MPLTDADRAFYEPWWARLKASWTRPQYVQNRLHRQFMEAVYARDAALRQERDEAELTARRAAHAAVMRRSRARDWALKLARLAETPPTSAGLPDTPDRW